MIVITVVVAFTSIVQMAVAYNASSFGLVYLGRIFFYVLLRFGIGFCL